MAEQNTSKNPKAYFEVSAVSKITGLSPNTLRTWERREFIRSESRSESGRRRYSQEQVEMLALMKKLTDLGDSISALSKLNLQDLRSRLLEYQARNTEAASTGDKEILISTVGDNIELWLSSLPSRFRAVRSDSENVDMVAIDLSVPDIECRRRVTLARHQNPGVPIVLIYDYAPKNLIKGFSNEGFFLIRVPCSPELFEHYICAALARASHQSAPQHGEAQSRDGFADRVFTDRQLTTIASSNPNIKCECPHHISALVASLVSFENYCNRCEDESPLDAEIHAHLGKEIASARSIVEQALLYLCERDNFKIPSP